MNKKQKRILIAITVIILGMLVYPPFHWRGEGRIVLSAGYGWIFDPPSYYPSTLPTVDTGLLVTQWLGVLIAGGIIYFILRDCGKPGDSPLHPLQMSLGRDHPPYLPVYHRILRNPELLGKLPD
jgi:hypothetical protein